MFHVLRHFSFASAPATVPIPVVSVVVYPNNTVNELVDLVENQNAATAPAPRVPRRRDQVTSTPASPSALKVEKQS